MISKIISGARSLSHVAREPRAARSELSPPAADVVTALIAQRNREALQKVFAEAVHDGLTGIHYHTA